MVNVLKPDPATIKINDIAHALSHQCRFSGHTDTFYSVAQHSIMVSQMLDGTGFELHGLLHDAAEAYLIDIPSPVKDFIPGFKTIEENLMRVISVRFNLVFPFDARVKQADIAALEFEYENLFENVESDLFFRKPGYVKAKFIERFNHFYLK